MHGSPSFIVSEMTERDGANHIRSVTRKAKGTPGPFLCADAASQRIAASTPIACDTGGKWEASRRKESHAAHARTDG